MRRSQLFLDLVTIRLECTCLSLRAGVAKGRVFLSRGICSDSPCTSSSGFLCMVCPGCALPEAETQRCHLGLLSPPSSGQGQAEGPHQAEAQKGLQTRLAGGGGGDRPLPVEELFLQQHLAWAWLGNRLFGTAFGNIVAVGWAPLLGKVPSPEPLVVCALPPPSELLKGWWGRWKSEWWEESLMTGVPSFFLKGQRQRFL